MGITSVGKRSQGEALDYEARLGENTANILLLWGGEDSCMADGALSDLKVLECSHHLPGAYCAKLLADMGAQVVKVEKPGCGDEARRRGPFPEDNPHPEKSGLFLYLNTSKRGITLNLEAASGREIFRGLIQKVDVLIEDWTPRQAEALGLEYENLRRINPQLVMTSITPFGQTGPFRDYKAYDLNMYHMGGLGYPGGLPDPEGEPLKCGGHPADFVTALAAIVATMTAVHHQQATGTGQHVDVSSLEAIASILEIYLQLYTYYGQTVLRTGRVSIGPGELLPCKDGYVMGHFLVADTDWQRFVEYSGEEWARDDMFKDYTSRALHRDVIHRLLEEWASRYTQEELYTTAQAHRVCVVPVYSIDALVHCAHLRARQFFVEVEHPQAGKWEYPGAPYRFFSTPWKVKRPAPLLGQHNQEIYGDWLGCRPEDLAQLRRAGII